MLMEEVVSRANMLAAFNRVWRNGGAPGVDGMPVDALWGLLPGALDADAAWVRLRDMAPGGARRAGPGRR